MSPAVRLLAEKYRARRLKQELRTVRLSTIATRSVTVENAAMLHRAAKPIPLSEEDRKMVRRLLGSSYLADAEKDELRQIEHAGDKGAFEQESLGQPMPAWPFYF